VLDHMLSAVVMIKPRGNYDPYRQHLDRRTRKLAAGQPVQPPFVDRAEFEANSFVHELVRVLAVTRGHGLKLALPSPADLNGPRQRGASAKLKPHAERVANAWRAEGDAEPQRLVHTAFIALGYRGSADQLFEQLDQR
jgi:hypothetical protein